MQGSRVLAFTAAVLGFVGLALALLGGPLGGSGVAIVALALLCLLAVAWRATEAPLAAQEPPQPEEWPAPPPPAELDFEYKEPDLSFQPEEPVPPPAPQEPAIDLDSPLQRALAGLPPKPSAPARYSPRMPVIPEEEQEPAEPVRRARRLVPSGQTLGEKREAARRAKEEEQQMEFTVVPAKPAPRPAVVPTPQVPIVVARVAGKGAAPPDLARGKCSGCDTLLWAPKTRPINLRCPKCDKITLLK